MPAPFHWEAVTARLDFKVTDAHIWPFLQLCVLCLTSALWLLDLKWLLRFPLGYKNIYWKNLQPSKRMCRRRCFKPVMDRCVQDGPGVISQSGDGLSSPLQQPDPITYYGVYTRNPRCHNVCVFGWMFITKDGEKQRSNGNALSVFFREIGRMTYSSIRFF